MSASKAPEITRMHSLTQDRDLDALTLTPSSPADLDAPLVMLLQACSQCMLARAKW